MSLDGSSTSLDGGGCCHDGVVFCCFELVAAAFPVVRVVDTVIVVVVAAISGQMQGAFCESHFNVTGLKVSPGGQGHWKHERP